MRFHEIEGRDGPYKLPNAVVELHRRPRFGYMIHQRFTEATTSHHSSMGSLDETPVFVDTNLGTHLALSVVPDITVGDLKRKLGLQHFICFPNLGEPKIHALMVKRKSYFYHLPDSMPIKNGFQDLLGTWFLRMDASLAQDISAQTTSIPFTVQHRVRQCSFGEGEPVKMTPDAPASENLTSLNKLQKYHCQDESIEVMLTQGISSSEIGDCLSDVSDVTDYSKPESVKTLTERFTECQSAKGGSDQCIFNKDQLKVLLPPVFSKQKRSKRKFLGHSNSDYALDGTLKDTEMGELITTKETLICGSGVEQEKRINGITTIKEASGNVLNDRNLSSGYLLESIKNRSSLSLNGTSSMSLSEKISITAIISRYFSEYDEDHEVDSCSSQPRSTSARTREMTKQCKDVQKIEETQQIDTTGGKRKAFPVDQESPKEASKSDPSDRCSSNSVSLDVKRFEHNLADKNRKKQLKSEMTAPLGERQVMRVATKTKKTTSSVVADEYEACRVGNGKSFKNKVNGSQKLVRRRLINGTPLSSSRRTLLFDKHMGASRIKLGKVDVGKGLILAASRIGLSTSNKRSLKSMFFTNCGNLSTPNSISVVRNIAFEISEDD